MKIRILTDELRKQAACVADHDTHLADALNLSAELLSASYQPEVDAESILASTCQLGLRNVGGTFVSVWDGGETVVSCPCIIDVVTRHIASIDADSREVWSSDDGIDEGNVDDAVELLDEQYVIIGEDVPLNHHPAVQKDELQDGDGKTYWYD